DRGHRRSGPRRGGEPAALPPVGRGGYSGGCGMTVRELPALEATRELLPPPPSERTLPNGLTVIVIERRSVPLVEVRLRVPFARSTLDAPFVAQGALMSQTLFSGTESMSTVDIAAALQTVGGALSAGVDADRLLIAGNGLASGLERILGILS